MLLRTVLALTLFIGIIESADTTDCTIQADADILGLGVRLGLYFQLVANFIVTIARPDEGVSSLSVSNILFTGIFIAILHSTVNNNVPAGEMLTMLALLPLDILASFPILVAAASKSSKVKPSIATVAFVMLRATGIVIFGLWFWYHGLDIPNPDQCIEPRVFLYANLGAYGGARIAYKVIVTFFMIFFGMALFVGSIFGCIFYCAKGPNSQVSYRVNDVEVTREEYHDASHSLRGIYAGEYSMQTFLWAAYLYACVVPLFIAAIELQIRWNMLEGLESVSTTGQIIPLTVGAISLFRSVTLAIVELFNRGNNAPESSETMLFPSSTAIPAGVSDGSKLERVVGS